MLVPPMSAYIGIAGNRNILRGAANELKACSCIFGPKLTGKTTHTVADGARYRVILDMDIGHDATVLHKSGQSTNIAIGACNAAAAQR
mgnify:CR=1 FL=1